MPPEMYIKCCVIAWNNFSVVIILLARFESAYLLILGVHEIWGQGGGEPLALLQ